MTEIDAGRLALRPIELETARALLSGQTPAGYSVVTSCWGQGYATEALSALLRELAVRQDVDRVVTETMVSHRASRRVMEKAGMTESGRRIGEEDGEAVELVGYEFVPSDAIGSVFKPA